MKFHHVAIRTGDIWQAINFYECLGFVVEERFTAGITLACWMVSNGTRLELMQIPEPQPAPDCFFDEHYTGYYHLSFVVADLGATLQTLADKLGRLKLLLPPREQKIGDRIYKTAFIADIDGLPIELIEDSGAS
ncbi:MAG: VOC family protein [Pseudanabaenaceae cyanobacterium SKYGB_i_bin29]|nr:VOC family protein [Pseudanabaenaceae cyanobacterium SKYG29]MDW8421511.1 VOC family protein [Pseudanabaenaceae cyanobacterium SKYGB_i_bin29]